MKFIILGRSRTGSNFLRGLLNSCSGVKVFGEVFKNPEKVEWGIDGYRESKRARDQYLTDPAAFLQSEIFGKRSVDKSAVGFKLFYYHAQTEPWDRIWTSLLSDRTVHILHMKRKNILRTFLSRTRAGETDAWVRLSDNEEQPMPRIHLSYQECLSEFVQTRRQEQEFDLLFAEHPLLEITYEDLSEDYSAELCRIQKFLGLPQEDVKPTTYKQSRDSLDHAIVNYQELKAKFTDSPWATFFEE